MNVQLVLFKEDGKRRDLEMKRDSVIVGRSGDCDFQIPLAVISRRHCKLTRKGDKLFVKDLGSSNGTFLNDKRILQAEVKAGDRISVGPVIFTIVMNGLPVEIEPVLTVLNAPAAASPVPEPVMEASAAPAAAIPETESDLPVESHADKSGGIDIIADLDGVSLDDSNAEEAELDDSGLSPLAELEALAKQRKK